MTETVRIGRVGKPHGREGSFFVEDASDDPQRYAVGTVLHAGDRRATIVESKRSGGRPVIRLDADVERGAELSIDRAALREPDEGAYYVFQLVGLAVEEHGGRELGRVVDVSPGVANDVLELDSGLALPMVDACVKEVDLAAGRIVVEPGFAGAE